MRKDCWMRGKGPLVPFGGVFRAELAEAGHPLGSQKHYLLLMSRLNRWLDVEGLEIDDLSVVTARRFLDATRATGQRRVPTMASLVPLFDCLRNQGVLPSEQLVELTARERFLAEYRHHLVHDRGLAPTTVRRYMNFARRFLAARASRTGSETGTEGLHQQRSERLHARSEHPPGRRIGQARGRRPAGAFALPVLGRAVGSRPRHGDASRRRLERHVPAQDHAPGRGGQRSSPVATDPTRAAGGTERSSR